MKTKLGILLVAVAFWATGCASSDESTEESVIAADDSGFRLSTEAEVEAFNLESFELLGDDTQQLFGCSNQQIRSAQAACRNTFCGSRGSNGIHFCDQRPPIVVAQCDCTTGADPTIQCSLTACPQ